MAVDDDFRLHEGATADIRLASNVGAVNRDGRARCRATRPRRGCRDGARAARPPDRPARELRRGGGDARPAHARRTSASLLGGLDAGDPRPRAGHRPDAAPQRAGARQHRRRCSPRSTSDGEALRTIVGDGERVVSSLAARPQDLGAAAERVAGAAATRPPRAGPSCSESVRELGPALARGPPGARRARRRPRPSCAAWPPRVGPVDRRARPVRAAAARTRPQAAGPLLAQTRRLVERGPGAAARSCGRSRAPPRRSPRKLEPVAREALPLARVLQVYVPETVGAFQNFGATAGAYDANGHVLNVASGARPDPARQRADRRRSSAPPTATRARRRRSSRACCASRSSASRASTSASRGPTCRPGSSTPADGGPLNDRRRRPGHVRGHGAAAGADARRSSTSRRGRAPDARPGRRPVRGRVPARRGDERPRRRRDRRLGRARSRSTTTGSPRSRCCSTRTIEPPRADATAAIRQQDTTGDSYVAFEPGRSRKPLREVDGRPDDRVLRRRPSERCPHTLVAPRLDDLLNAFGPVRAHRHPAHAHRAGAGGRRARQGPQPRRARPAPGPRGGQPRARRRQPPERRAAQLHRRRRGGHRPGGHRAAAASARSIDGAGGDARA